MVFQILAAWRPRLPGYHRSNGLVFPSCPPRLMLCKEAAPQHQPWGMAGCTVGWTTAPGLGEGLKALLASPGPGGLKCQAHVCVLAALKHSEEDHGQTGAAGELTYGLAAAGRKEVPRGSPACCLQILVGEGGTCSVLSSGSAELLAGLLVFAEHRAHGCLGLPGSTELHRVRQQTRLPSPYPISGLCGLCLHSVKCW